jgi:phenylalanyl-tRNA synthetase beta chain
VKFSLDWLGDFVDVAAAGGPQEIHRVLNLAGIEIGALERVGADTVLDADITPNRPDAMNHRGLARDLAAACGVPFRGEAERYRDPGGVGDPAESLARVTIEVPERCRRFAVRVIRSARTVPSSAIIRRRLEAIGSSPQNVLVDATNLSLWEIGQPLHAFDAGKVAGRHLIVRYARAGEKLRLLDGVERELHPEDVVVADEERALSLAGIMGGAESAISEATTDVLLEAAWWDPVSIRRTARRHGLHTDASHRYERGADLLAIPEGLSLASREIVQTAGGRLAPGVIDAYPRPFAARQATLRLERLRSLSGEPALDLARAADVLRRLGFEVERGSPDLLRVRIPSWRPDVEIEEDLIEEVVRIHGYDRIPSLLPPVGEMRPRFLEAPSPTGEPAPRDVEDRAADGLRESGLVEAVDYPFSPGEPWEGDFGNLLAVEGFPASPMRIENPIDSARAGLRRLVLPGLLESVSRNFRNGSPSTALFEIGRVWDREGSRRAAPEDTPAYESRHAAFAVAGQAPEFWDRPPRGCDFFDGRAVLERLVEAFPETGGLDAFRLVPLRAKAFLPGAAGALLDRQGRRVAALGCLAESQRRLHHLPPATVAGEIDLSGLRAPRALRRFAAYSPFPPIDVDITLLHGPEVTWETIAAELDAAALAELESRRYANRFAGAGVPEGRVKSTISLRFRSAGRTLSQDEVNRERDRFLEVLQRKFGVKT